MTSTPKKSTEADDVLEFLNSLPENRDKSGTFRAKTNKGVAGKDSDDVLDFLDELEKSDLRKKDTKQSIDESKKDTQTAKDEGTHTNEKQEQPTVTEKYDVKVDETGNVIQNNEGGDDFIDPIASISNWWSSSGSNAVNSLWNNAKSIQQKATEEASKLANEASKKLSDEKEHVERLRKINAFKFLGDNFESILNSLNIDDYDEFIKIYVIHDLMNFEGLEKTIERQFKNVLTQVEGDIFIEVDKKNTVSDEGKRRMSVGAHSGVKKLNLFEGGVSDADKLNWANLTSSIKENNDDGEKNKSENNEQKEVTDLNISKIYISILPYQIVSKTITTEEEFQTIDSKSSKSFQFRIILKDLDHNISLVSETQSFPIKWAKWIEYNTEQDNIKGEENNEEQEDTDIDPAEWVREWIDRGLDLTLGTLAQEYVIKRMGFD